MFKQMISIVAVAGLVLALVPAAQAAITEVIPPEGGYPASYRLIFVTSYTTGASSSDIGYYNTFVDEVANNIDPVTHDPLAVPTSIVASLGADWYAIGSTYDGATSVYARDNTNTAGTGGPYDVPIYNLDGLLFATGNAALWGGSAVEPVTRTESGDNVESPNVWTGTSVNGTCGTWSGYGLGGQGYGGKIRYGSPGGSARIRFDYNETTGGSRPLYALSAPIIPEPALTALGYWNNGSTGDWSAAAANWNTASDGSGSDVTWNGNETSTAVFSADTSAPGPLTVTINGSVGVGLIQFRDDDVTLTGGAIDNSAADGSLELDAAAGRTAAIASNISLGAGGLTKSGDGTVILSGTNSYTGATDIDAGTLVVDSSIASSSLTTVAPGATLKGSGGVGPLLLVAGTVSPGTSVGTLPAGNTTWTDGSSFLFEIDDAAGTAGTAPGWDLLNIAGTLDLNPLTAGGFTIDIDTLLTGGGTNPGEMSNFDELSGYTWEFVRTSGGILGLLEEGDFLFDTSGVANAFTGDFGISQNGDSLYLTYTASSIIPEPSTVLLFAFGSIGILFMRRRGLRR